MRTRDLAQILREKEYTTIRETSDYEIIVDYITCDDGSRLISRGHLASLVNRAISADQFFHLLDEACSSTAQKLDIPQESATFTTPEETN